MDKIIENIHFKVTNFNIDFKKTKAPVTITGNTMLGDKIASTDKIEMSLCKELKDHIADIEEYITKFIQDGSSAVDTPSTQP